jgi:hypothetical protein
MLAVLQCENIIFHKGKSFWEANLIGVNKVPSEKFVPRVANVIMLALTEQF